MFFFSQKSEKLNPYSEYIQTFWNIIFNKSTLQTNVKLSEINFSFGSEQIVKDCQKEH